MSTTERIIHSTAGIELVRKLAESGDRIFTLERVRKIAPAVGLSTGYLRQALHYLARSGWVVRLRKGLYSLSSSVPGVSPLHEFEVGMALVHPAAISHWSALHHHGLTEQLPRRVFVLTTTGISIPRLIGTKKNKRKSDKGYPAGGTIYQFVQVKPERFFGIEETWVGETRIKMTDPERTLLDGLMMPRYCGDFAEVLHAFQVRGPELDLDKIIRYSLKLDAATGKRLGWILEQQGIGLSRLQPLRAIPSKGYRVLDTIGPHRGPCNRRWMIQENLPGKVGK
ncbi:MAG: type IV toxin-antitoxin system AbiEi family antitoxin domain-containing protein [Elusimicrobia bacterium]|nr:type IV toxin-antitoxin system AbiEi family antitoxin domain-containing protein [Elusimicrobiota bacterium]